MSASKQRPQRQERCSQHKDAQGHTTICLPVEHAEGLKSTHLDQEIVQPRDVAEQLLSNDVQLCCHLGSRPLLDPFDRAIRSTGNHHSVQQNTPLAKTTESYRKSLVRSERSAFVHLLWIEQIGRKSHALRNQSLGKLRPHAGRLESTFDFPILIETGLLEGEEFLQA